MISDTAAKVNEGSLSLADASQAVFQAEVVLSSVMVRSLIM